MTNVVTLRNTGGFTRMDNELYEALHHSASMRLIDEMLPADLSSCDIRVLLFVFTRTIGARLACARLAGKDIAEGVSIDQTAASRTVSRLLQQGFLFRIGGSRGAIGIACLRDLAGLSVEEPADQGEVLGDDQGYVYLMANEAMPGIMKVGMTRRLPQDRAEELSRSTSSPAPFIVERAVIVTNPRAVEQAVHEALSASRISQNREFFRVTAEEFDLAVALVTAEGAA